jgi:hypothetical protein
MQYDQNRTDLLRAKDVQQFTQIVHKTSNLTKDMRFSQTCLTTERIPASTPVFRQLELPQPFVGGALFETSLSK